MSAAVLRVFLLSILGMNLFALIPEVEKQSCNVKYCPDLGCVVEWSHVLHFHSENGKVL